MRPVEHHIQRQILRDLSSVESMRFRDLKPGDIDNNSFTYHLKNLVAAGLIEKIDSEYMLTTKGLTYLDYAGATKLIPRLQPKLITIVVIQTEDKVAMLKRKRQPYLGKLMLPSGKMHFGEDFAGHARREAKEKLGLEIELEMRGAANILISQQGTPITHVVASVYAANLPKEQDIYCAYEERFDALWIPKKDLGSTDLLSVTQNIVDLVNNSGQHFFKDFAVDQDS